MRGPRADAGADGAAFMAERLAWCVARRDRGRGPSALAVFDLDNTLFDTRWRTLAAARAFDAARGEGRFEALELEPPAPAHVRRDGRATAAQAALGPLPGDVVEAFARYWGDYFWRPASLALDQPIAAVVAHAVAAREAGAELRFLTGRVEGLRAATREALARVGLDASDAALACKPDLATRTAPWKSEVLAAWSREAPLAWYLSEGRRDLARIQADVPVVPCVLLDCSFEDPALRLAPETPVLARAF